MVIYMDLGKAFKFHLRLVERFRSHGIHEKFVNGIQKWPGIGDGGEWVDFVMGCQLIVVSHGALP